MGIMEKLGFGGPSYSEQHAKDMTELEATRAKSAEDQTARDAALRQDIQNQADNGVLVMNDQPAQEARVAEMLSTSSPEEVSAVKSEIEGEGEVQILATGNESATEQPVSAAETIDSRQGPIDHAETDGQPPA